MERLEKLNRHILAKWVALHATLVLSFLVLINALTFVTSPINGEDYGLSRMSTGVNLTDKMVWVLHRSWFQITHWNARLGEQLAIFWMEMPRAYLDAAFITFYLLFLYIIMILSVRHEGAAEYKNRSIIIMSITAIFLELLWPRFEVFFWKTGFSEYLQPLILNMSFLVAFSSRSRILETIKITYFPIFIIAAFMAGLCFENVSPGIFVYMALMIYLDFRDHRIVSTRKVVIALSYLFGWLLLVNMPSTKLRENIYNQMYGFQNYNFDYYVNRVTNIITVFLDSSWQLLVAFLASTAFVLYMGEFRRLRSIYLLCVAAFISNAVLIFAPYTEPRAFVFTWTVMSVCCVASLNSIVPMCNKKNLFRQGVYVLVGLLAVGEAMGCYSNYFDFNREVMGRYDYIKSQVGSSRCVNGLPIALISTTASSRILANREIWVANSLNQVGNYFGCKLVLQKNNP